MHELVISCGRTGYLALYEYVEPLDAILILCCVTGAKRVTRITSGRSSLVGVGSREGLRV